MGWPDLDPASPRAHVRANYSTPVFNQFTSAKM